MFHRLRHSIASNSHFDARPSRAWHVIRSGDRAHYRGFARKSMTDTAVAQECTQSFDLMVPSFLTWIERCNDGLPLLASCVRFRIDGKVIGYVDKTYDGSTFISISDVYTYGIMLRSIKML